MSSVVEGFAEFREAARAGITAAGGEAVLVNEDFPSLSQSSRNACLDAIDSSDYLISIVGNRGGWTTPAGVLVVEEEYDHARRKRLPIFAFLQRTVRDPDATRFADRLSDYVDGTFRRTFDSPEDLSREVERALEPLMSPRAAMSRQPVQHFASPYAIQHTAMARLVFTPERHEEVVDPVRLQSPEFLSTLYEIGHRRSVRLMSYETSKKSEARDGSLVIVQTPGERKHGQGEHVRVEIAESGELVIDANVTGRVTRGTAANMVDSFVVAVEDIESVLRTGFLFTAAFFDDVDPFKRHQRFEYNVGLSGLGYRSIERNPQARTSHGMAMRSKDAIAAFDEPRVIDRVTLGDPTSEIERVVVLLTRKAGT